jgi:hypothetical protein
MAQGADDEDMSKILEGISDDADAEMDLATDDGENGQKASDNEMYTPIKALSTFIYDWRIKARLTKKGIRKTYKNSRTEGYFMHIELMDAHGTMIQATGGEPTVLFP